jgi:hypothetical protein
VEKTGVPAENHWPATSHWQALSHNVVSSIPCHEWESNSHFFFQREATHYNLNFWITITGWNLTLKLLGWMPLHL